MDEQEIEKILNYPYLNDFEQKKILIIGGAGFIGSWLCDILLRLNSNVVCMDNLSSGLTENISRLNLNKNFCFINHDITDNITFNDKFDLVMHLASRASPFEFDKFPIEILKSNTIGTLNSLEIARKNKAIYIYTSTSEVYGDAEIVPTSESYNGNVNPIGIRGCYDEAKRAGEALCMAFLKQYDVDVRIARIFNTYGPRMRHDGYYGRVVPRFIDQAVNNQPITIFGNGTQTRSFCYITDLVNGLIKLASTDLAKGEVFNIGNPEEINILGLAKLIKIHANSISPFVFHSLPPDDPKRRCPDIEKATNILKWSPTISINTGLKKTIKFITNR